MKLYAYLVMLFLTSIQVQAQEHPHIYTNTSHYNQVFISLSSGVLVDESYLEESLKYVDANETAMLMGPRTRSNYMKALELSDNDTIVAFSFTLDKTIKLPLKEIDFTAIADEFSDIYDDENQLIPESFQVGVLFPYSKHPKLKEAEYFFIGKEDPFICNKMQQIVWKEVANTTFPIAMHQFEKFEQLATKKLEVLHTYFFENHTYQFHYQICTTTDGYNLPVNKFVVLNKHTKEKIRELSFSEGEALYIDPVGIQYTGTFLKDQPDVITGFYSGYYPLGSNTACTDFLCIASDESYIKIDCDNRH